MRCCASPTTSIVPESASASADAARAFASALIFREILKPLAAALGPVGETALDPIADRLFPIKPR